MKDCPSISLLGPLSKFFLAKMLEFLSLFLFFFPEVRLLARASILVGSALFTA